MRIVAAFEQAKGESISRTLTWTGDLNGSTISTVTWTVPTGLTNAASSNTTTAATIRLTADTPGVYRVDCSVTTAASETLKAAFQVTVSG